MMSVGSFLAGRENIAFVEKNSWKFGRPAILEKGMRYYEEHPGDIAHIKNNMAMVGLSNTDEEVRQVCEEIVLHYYEKLFALVKRYEVVWMCRNRVEIGDSLEPFREARADGKSVFVAQSHFGATYLLGSVLTVNGFDLSMVGKFPEPIGSMLNNTGAALSERYGTGKVKLINLADPECDAPMDMMMSFMSKKIISNVFDENNEFSRPVPFMDRTVFGGSGMDMLLKNFNDDKVILITPFLRRTGEDSFSFEVERHYFKDGDIIESFYRALEKKVRAYPAQWYFLAELDESFEDKRIP